MDLHFVRAVDAGLPAEFEAALADHRQWLQRWHSARLCGAIPGNDIVATDPAEHCAIGRWLQHQTARMTPWPGPFASLADAHAALHAQARQLALAEPGPLSVPDYGLLLAAVEAFEQLARPIQLAFERALSDLDPLTWLLNRRGRRVALERERARSRRGGLAAAIAIGDLDYFKSINDAHGHSAGDHVLQSVAEVFLTELRPYDSVYRYGGEEFLFCLPSTDGVTAQLVLDRLRAGLSALTVPEIGGDARITMSFGIAPIEADVTVEETIERADRALYAAKRAGRNRVVSWHGPVPIAIGAVA
ncbi:MAG: diguanylate cyclase [Alphaproteobacteria bacterium]|nr:diguanylate cyclase [Alphaproteobacteria bacterium]